ncbi:MAG: cell division protein FtsL [Gammaproteobacteria bacterium CG22_combo_CG10-13_8_21_14_all_40_8]|nr:MAG: cell division protein FtsL [Gammaproteobacteria bacterium CG22_combo_CG10-13_8_21_14_all_40_8]
MTKESKKNKLSRDNHSLLMTILVDLFSQRKTLLLLVLLVSISAIAVTWSTQKARELNSQWAKLVDNRNKINVDWRKLRLEYRALAEHSRIENLARKKLNMQPVTADKEKVIR